jgi:hypothetical protein
MFLIDIRDPPIVNRTPLDSSRRDDSVGMISLATKSILRLRGFDENSQKGRETDIWWCLYTVNGRWKEKSINLMHKDLQFNKTRQQRREEKKHNVIWTYLLLDCMARNQQYNQIRR